jgi:hypothetical protein
MFSDAEREKPSAPVPGANYYGLLYIDRDHGEHVNLRTGRDPVEIYVGCASLLAASARSAGERLVILTNAAKELRRIASDQGFPPFDCVEIPFELEIPSHARFFQAHFKLSALEAMGSGSLGSFCGLIDIDAVLQGPLSVRLSPGAGVHAYPIDEALAGGSLEDLDLLLGPAERPRRWFGGEFIAGDWESLRCLSYAIKILLPHYIESMPRLTHVGDETVVSAALNLIEEVGVPIHDVSQGRTVARWYSSRLLVPQERLGKMLDATVLHLPCDKVFLQDQARRWLGPERFKRSLVRHVLGKSFIRSLANPVLMLAGGERKYAPQF